MSIEHKSIFLKVKEYKGDPITEYNKICKFLQKDCYYSHSLYSLLECNFQCSLLLRPNYVDFEDCLNDCVSNLNTYSESVFEYLDENTQESLLDDFLTYCEIIIHMQLVAYNNDVKDLLHNSNFDKEIYLQLTDLIKTSLKSMNHDIKVCNEETSECVAIKCNAEAEAVAEQSPLNLKKAIIYYLGARDADITEKENRLHKIIDLLEPILRTYKELEAVKKVEEYVQLIRHPETKKDDIQYKWFFNNKEEYIDSIFLMCIFVKEYDITKQTIKKFESLKRK